MKSLCLVHSLVRTQPSPRLPFSSRLFSTDHHKHGHGKTPSSSAPHLQSVPASQVIASTHVQSSVDTPLPHNFYSAKRATPVSIKMMLDHTKEVNAETVTRIGRWLQDELPIRLAHQVKAIDRMPYGLCLMPSVKRIRKWYIESINDVHRLPKIRTRADVEEFSRVLGGLYARHSKTLIAMCKGLYELKQELHAEGDFEVEKDVDVVQFLDDFYSSRIGIRTLVSHFLALQDQLSKPVTGFVGLICTRTSAAQVVQDAIHDARFMCTRTHGDAPEVIFRGNTNLTFPSIPSHIYYIIFELLKNSLRAVAERHGLSHITGDSYVYVPPGESRKVPAIQVIVADSKENEDVAIKISDEGGGIKRSHLPKIWSYLYTTAKSDFATLSSFEEPDDFGTQAPLAGLGCGLPLSRLYARHFGGDLQLLSLEGHGTDAYLHIPRLGDKMEPLTQFIK